MLLLFLLLLVVILIYRVCPMSLEIDDDPPFTLEQSAWIDRMVKARASALVRAGSEATTTAQADQPTTSAVTITTTSLTGESVKGSVRDQKLKRAGGCRLRLSLRCVCTQANPTAGRLFRPHIHAPRRDVRGRVNLTAGHSSYCIE